MFNNKELIIRTPAGYYYKDDKSKKSKNLTDVITGDNYVIINKSTSYWGFGGFLIEPGDEPGSIFLSIYFVRQLGTTGDPVEVKSCRLNKAGEKWRLKLKSNEENPDYDKKICLLSNYNAIGKNKGFDYNCWWSSMAACQDLNDSEWSDRPMSLFCNKTKQILKDAGFPENIFTSTDTVTKLDDLLVFNEYFKRRQQEYKESKSTIKYKALFDNIDFCDVIDNNLCIKNKDYRLVFNNKGLRVWFVDNSKWKPLTKQDLSLDFTPKQKDILKEIMIKQKELSNFECFINEYSDMLFRNRQWYGSNLFVFLKSISDKYNRRFIENIVKLDPSSVIRIGYEEKKYYVNVLTDSEFKSIDVKQWKLTKQLRMNKDQIKMLMKNTNSKNRFLSLWSKIHQQFSRIQDNREYIYFSNDRTIIDFTTINNKNIEILLNWYKNHKDTWLDPCGVKRIESEDIDQYFERINKFWAYPNSEEMRSTYNDYLSMRQRLLSDDMINKENYPILPETCTDIYALHDQLTEIIEQQKRAIQKGKIMLYQKQTEKLAEKWHYEDNTYTIDLVRDPAELKIEGSKLHHCVGSYVDRVIEQQEYILFLRRKIAPKEPFLTVNIDPSKTRISQIHGQFNWWLGNWPEVVPFVMRWLKKIKIDCPDDILLSTAKGYCEGGAPRIPKPVID